jgi:hypothetical protein
MNETRRRNVERGPKFFVSPSSSHPGSRLILYLYLASSAVV